MHFGWIDELCFPRRNEELEKGRRGANDPSLKVASATILSNLEVIFLWLHVAHSSLKQQTT